MSRENEEGVSVWIISTGKPCNGGMPCQLFFEYEVASAYKEARRDLEGMPIKEVVSFDPELKLNVRLLKELGW